MVQDHIKVLSFERRKYGSELLIDATDEIGMANVPDTLALSFYSIMFLKKSTGTYYLDTEKIDLGDHLVLFIKPGQINKIKNVQFTKCHLLFFEGDFLDEFFNDKNFIFKFGYFHNPQLASHLNLSKEKFDKYDSLAAEIKQEIQNLSPDSHHILRSIIYYLMARLNQDYSQLYGSSKVVISDPKILAFLQLVQAEIKEQHTVQVYADKLNISRVHLNNLCQKNFSKTANKILKEALIAEVKKELKYAPKDLAEIAYDFNFSAPSHFSRFVKQMTGLSPLAFREALSNW